MCLYQYAHHACGHPPRMIVTHCPHANTKDQMWVRDRDGNSLGWATACFAEIRPRNNAPKVATELPRILACSPVCKGKIEVLQAQLLLDYPGEAGEHHARFAGRVEHVAFYLAGGRFPVLGHPGSLPRTPLNGNATGTSNEE